MDYPNLMSTTIPEKEVTEIKNAISFIDRKLSNLITLTEEDMSHLPKVGDDTVPFVLQNIKEAQHKPDLIPPSIDIDEIKKDVKLIKAIDKILKPLKKLERKLEDSLLLAGSEAYLPSLAIYNAMKAEELKKKHQKKKMTS